MHLFNIKDFVILTRTHQDLGMLLGINPFEDFQDMQLLYSHTTCGAATQTCPHVEEDGASLIRLTLNGIVIDYHHIIVLSILPDQTLALMRMGLALFAI